MVSRLSTSRDFSENGSRLNVVAIIYHIINDAIRAVVMVNIMRRICPGKKISSSNNMAIGRVTVFCLVKKASVANSKHNSVQISLVISLGFNRAWI